MPQQEQEVLLFWGIPNIQGINLNTPLSIFTAWCFSFTVSKHYEKLDCVLFIASSFYQNLVVDMLIKIEL
jgi:hypothetical protein